jgi:hypothetical protein
VASRAADRRFPGFDPGAGETILTPDAAGPGYWVGAPSLATDRTSGRVLMAYRLRRPRDGSPLERGYRVAVGESRDGGRSFHPVWRVTKEEVGTSSLERFCLRRDDAGDWRLYTSWEDPPSSGRWRISVLRAPQPEQFDIAAAVDVLAPADVGVDAVKDPYVLDRDGERLMYISTFLTPAGPAPTSLAWSRDSVRFTWMGETLPVASDGAWDGYQARISSVTPWEDGFVAYYDGAASRAEDTEEHAGIACSLDLERWQRVSVDAPALVSPHATGSLRYIDVVEIGGESWAYYEYARADGSHELRRSRLELR